jgi:hypothetical protein
MDWDQCRSAALSFLKHNGLPGVQLAENAKLMGDAKGAHLHVLREEYFQDYKSAWPGCSERDQWTAVNWEDQIYVNSKDHRLLRQCSQNDPKALAAVLSHEIFHIKAKSNYCANETNCLFEHEMLAHMYEDLLNGGKERLGGPDLKRLSKQVFQNYLAHTMKNDSIKQRALRKLMMKRMARKFHRAGILRARVAMHDVELMTRIGLDHFSDLSRNEE